MNIVASYLTEKWAVLPVEGLPQPERFPCLIATPRFRASTHVIFFVLDPTTGGLRFVAKVARLPGDHARLMREANNLVLLREQTGMSSVPRIIACEIYQDHFLLVETALPGRALSARSIRKQARTVAESMTDWLIALHQATVQPGTAKLHERWAQRHIDQPLRRLAQIMRPVLPEVEPMVEQTIKLVDPLRGEHLPLVFEHRDLGPPNILVSKQGLGVVDWELAEPTGLPLVDLIFLLCLIAFAQGRATSTERYLASFDNAFLGRAPWAWPHIARYAVSMGLKREQVDALFLLTWPRYVAELVERLHDDDSTDPAVTGETASWLRQNRYFAVWHRVLEHVREVGSRHMRSA